MSNPTPRFWAGPLRYLRWSARERPAYFYSVVIGAAGPLMLVTVPPIQQSLGYKRAPPIPMTYPSASNTYFAPSFSSILQGSQN
ncbi:uncharacterized protein PG998_011107 [Apiospora kogelbergensis]|uniref:uncharacterized protein n=1 Tax=Apiospora kogelbergensis TaxID=1337665 RepID=UPI00313247D3